ncbi:MAG: hypothetical protein L7U72_17470 [Rubripirellula sp.]|nr:hypothetical protein [Rubripirellula sp.]
MSRRKRGLSPTLFPFLAVLVCTLGTLILLLALVSQNATANVSTTSPPNSAQENPASLTQSQADQLIREESFKLGELIAARELQTKDLEQTRDQRTHLENHIQKINDRINYLKAEIDTATNQEPQPEIKDQQLASAIDHSNSLAETLKKLKNDSQNTTPKLVIVPHQGPNGTDRRAIYLECKPDGLTIWPEGSTITLDQLMRSNDTGNPLDAALRTIRLHALQVYEDENAPYPLLIVRPNGIECYAAARRCMESWDDQFGYELIESSVELAFPPRDEILGQKVEKSIAAAIQLQRHHVAGSSETPNDRRRHRTANTKNLPTLSAAAMERSSRANGYRQLSDAPYANSQFQPTSDASNSEARGHYADRNDPITPSNISYPPKPPAKPSDSITNTNDLRQRPNISKRPSYTTPLPEVFNDTDQDITSHPKTTTPNSLPEGSVNESSTNNPYPKQSATPSPISQLGITNSTQSSTTNENQNNPNTEQTTGSDLGSSETTHGSKASQTYTSKDGTPQVITRDKGGSATYAPSLSQGQMNGSSSSIGSAMELPNQELDERMPELAIQPQATVPPSIPKKLLSKIGSNWAIPPSAARIRGTAIVRKLRVEAHENRFILLPSRQVSSIEIFSFFDGNIDRASLQLATAIHDRIMLWGPALPGGRWQPTIEVLVESNAEEAFSMLQRNFARSGLYLEQAASK